MLLTLYYMAATWMQSWRLRSVCAKITAKVAEQMSIVFYNLPIDANDVNLTPVSSELCTNNAQARVTDFLWHRENQRGAVIVPRQNIYLSPWITFPSLTPSLVPFDFTDNHLELNEEHLVYLLLETDIVPSLDEHEVLSIENFGKPLAWKVDSNIAIIMKSDLKRFTELVSFTFMQDFFIINDKLPLIRIESVSIEGTPQPFELLKNHAKKEFFSRAMGNLSTAQWEKHLDGLRSLGIMAQQATEFEYNKNRTEGKTGIVKPDLISSKNIEETLKEKSNKSSENSPVKKIATLPIAAIQTQPINIPTIMKKISPITSPKTSPKTSPMKPLEIRKITPINVATVASSSNNVVIQKKNSDVPPELKLTSTNPQSSVPDDVNSSKKNYVPRKSLQRSKNSKGSLLSSKPPNVLVYSDSLATRDNVIGTLKNVLEKDMYTIYPLTATEVKSKVWLDNTTLLVVCGAVNPDVDQALLDFFLKGGKMLCLCSDLLHIVLPTYRTAEVRENELVQFSYGRWQKVKMMHHIFCYQPSPVKKHFSHDSDEPQIVVKKPVLVCPRSVEVKDQQGLLHSIDVQVLGTEETWNTPSLMLAYSSINGGKAVFSQVHLEADPVQFEGDENMFNVLKQSDKARLEILTDLLSSHLGVSVTKVENKDKDIKYTYGYFLGRHEAKFELLAKLKPLMEVENVIKNGQLVMQFCGKGDNPPTATENLLPILIHSCPENFSTVDYFDSLKTEKIGRLVIYVPVLTSSMNVINNVTLGHGIVVIPRHQTQGSGRGSNQWLSPDGCLMFSLQLHIPLSSPLGQRISLIQHLVVTAIVHGILSMEGYEDLDIRLKWPNDIYANGTTKIGGLITNSLIESSQAVCNIGCGLNLNNSAPTVCINDLIKDYNSRNDKNLPLLAYEKVLALIFNEIEYVWNRVQSGDMKFLYDLYYKYWLHNGIEVTMMDSNGSQKTGKVMGIDDYGYLSVQVAGKRPESVHPDGNSFDMLRGLILPKVH